MKRLLKYAAATAGLAGVLAVSTARAEIYGWVDASGAVTYSNLPPPKGARVIDTIKEVPVDASSQAQARAAADAAHQAQLQALNDRLRELENEVQQARRAPPAVAYPPAPPAPPSFAAADCDGQFYDCDAWAGPVYYSVGLLGRWPGYRFADGHMHHLRHHTQSGGVARGHPSVAFQHR